MLSENRAGFVLDSRMPTGVTEIKDTHCPKEGPMLLGIELP